MRTQDLRRIGFLAVLAAVAAGSGCSTMNNTERGAVGGGVIGTAGGAAVGAATGRPLLGAVVGGLAGTAGGALIGNAADKEDNRRKDIAQAAAVADAQAQAAQLGVAGVMGLAQAGHSDQVIINEIRRTRSTFQLSTADLDMLKNAGVSQAVIAEMQAASRPAYAVPPARVVSQPTTVIYETAPPVVVRPAPYVVVGPPPPPRPVVIYGHYHHRR